VQKAKPELFTTGILQQAAEQFYLIPTKSPQAEHIMFLSQLTAVNLKEQVLH
jgi:hypothetical protein